MLPACEDIQMNEQLKRLRDAVTGRDREVEVGPDGRVHEVKKPDANEPTDEVAKPTKISDRVFGH